MEAFKTVIFSSHDEYFRSPQGAISVGSSVKLKILIHESLSDATVSLRLWENEKETIMPLSRGALLKDSPYGSYLREFSIIVPRETLSIAWYFFIIESCGKTLYCINNEDMLGGEGHISEFRDERYSFQLSTVDADFSVPDWAIGANMYQIFPDRFSKKGECEVSDRRMHSAWNEFPEFLPGEKGYYAADDFFGGNFKGIEEKLDYLKELNIDVIYLNPIFLSFSNHRYDTADYMQADPLLGTNDDFVHLCKAAKKRGIRVILDGVFSHTGSNSIYFNRENRFNSVGAYQSKNSPYFSWYDFQSFPDKYTSWWGVWSLPCVNELDEKYQEYILKNENSVAKHWLELGASGWRLDVADELPDEFIETLRTHVKSKDPDALVLGEVWEDASNKVSYDVRRRFLWGKELDSVMNYPLRAAIIDFMHDYDGEKFCRRILSLRENYPKQTFYCLMNFIATHDTPRAINALTGDNSHLTREEKASVYIENDALSVALSLQKLASLICFALPGMFSVYYGDEIAMQGESDPFNRQTFDLKYKNSEMLNWYRVLGNSRDDVFKRGSVDLDSAGALLSIRRNLGKKTKSVLINPTDDTVETMLDLSYFVKKPTLLFASQEGVQFSPRENGWYVLMPARSGAVFECFT